MKSAENIRAYQFQKGRSGNPGGCPKLPEHLKAIRLISAPEVARIVSKYAMMTKEEMKNALEDPKITILELGIASVFSKAISEGDIGRLNQILDRTIGKVKDVPIDNEDDLEKVPLPKLIEMGKEAIKFFSKEGTENEEVNEKSSAKVKS